jgi:ProP effector
MPPDSILSSRLTASPAIKAAATARGLAARAPDHREPSPEHSGRPSGHTPADPATAAENARREAEWHTQKAAQKAAHKAKQERLRTERLALLALLRECGCQVFDRPQPLAIGIYAELRAFVGDAVPAAVSKDLLRRWTLTDAYIAAVADGQPRVHLDGSPAGAVSDDHRQHAAALLALPRAGAAS